ncbi:MAG: hypothetical protein KBC95_03980 [Candidatus Peribacteraceae bacterium]|nr:hypothetical protein [Candidatus Peribacteraceae bacterium]
MPDPIELSDGTYLYPIPGRDNIHTDHYHVAADGTILSIKEDDEYSYNRAEVRRHINEVTGMDFPPRY